MGGISMNLLKRMRYFKGYKQYEMADEIGISRQAYNYKENGKLCFNTYEIIKISERLELTLQQVNEIFFYGKLPN